MHKRFSVSWVSLGLCPSSEHVRSLRPRGVVWRPDRGRGFRDEREECRVLRAVTEMDWDEQTDSDMERQAPS